MGFETAFNLVYLLNLNISYQSVIKIKMCNRFVTKSPSYRLFKIFLYLLSIFHVFTGKVLVFQLLLA